MPVFRHGCVSRSRFRIQSFASLNRRGQLARLRRLGLAALDTFGLEEARLRPLRHEHNTTFKVDADGGPYVLRINRPDVHSAATIASEMTWLAALKRDTNLGVPDPVATPDGSLTVVAVAPGIPEPRHCVLLRWLEGRFVDENLAPVHLRRVGALEAALQLHTEGWAPPPGFARPRLDALTTPGRRESVVGSAQSNSESEHPSQPDAERCLQLVTDLMSREAASVIAQALEVVWGTTNELRAQAGTFGLIHGDLHYENFLFHGGTARAIDFDDCGWGFHLYDLAVTLWELEDRPHFEALRTALLEEYSRFRPLPERYGNHLQTLIILRRVQILMWVLESREHAAFRDDWRGWAIEDLARLSGAIGNIR